MTQDEINKIKTNGMLNSLASTFSSINWDARRELEVLEIRSDNALSTLVLLESKLASLRQLRHEYVALCMPTSE